MTDVLSPDNFTFVFAAVVALLLLLTGCNKASEGQEGGFPPPAVSVAEVIVRDITPWEEFNGRIEAKEVVQIRSRVSGVIEEIKYHEGDMVKKGDLLFIIDQHSFRAELNRAGANLARAQAQAILAQSEIQRAKDLVKRKLLSPDEYDQRVAAENAANANVQSAKATLQLANLNLEYTEIRSPIDGRTGRALVTKGNLVASDPTPDLLTTIRSLDPVYVNFDSDELTYLRYFANAKQVIGKKVNIQRTVFVGLGNEEDFPRKGFVDFVDNRLDPDTGTIRLRAVLDNKNYQLIPGLFARVKLLAMNSEQAILINDRAILTDQDRQYVYVLGDKNTAIRRDVKIGRTFEEYRIVTEGLKPGEKIIVHGIQKVFFPNMPVMPQVINMNDSPPLTALNATAEH